MTTHPGKQPVKALTTAQVQTQMERTKAGCLGSGVPGQVSNEKIPGCLGFIGDEKLPSYMGIIINHYKDPY